MTNKKLIQEEFQQTVKNSSMTVLEIVGVPDSGMSIQSLKGKSKYRQSKLSEYSNDSNI